MHFTNSEDAADESIDPSARKKARAEGRQGWGDRLLEGVDWRLA
jgi:hypothetical protein